MATDYKALKSGGFLQQQHKDTFSMRLKVVGGHLTAGQLTAAAAASEKYGRGYVHLTSRQGLEIPFIKLADVENIKADLAAGGLEPGGCGPRVRTVTACQGSDICPNGCIETRSLAQAISDRYYGRTLPHKFKIGLTGCQNNCLKAEENDLGIKGVFLVAWKADDCTLCGVCLKACRLGALTSDGEAVLHNENLCSRCGRCVKACPTGSWSGQPAYMLSFGGTFGSNIALGRKIAPVVSDREAVLKAADAALDFFAAQAQPGERFRRVLDREGWEKFSRFLESRL
ncbi:MAG: 4Fe-4S binding protein [Deltaproteobacteria bacterium]|jgi:dissimilatory sulfite reductase (desulfoviridin) alpha/beta subunit|nr:4Fe-4S binding protein [Deltaproteobacteria bacterium]